MYQIKFYRDARGREPFRDFLNRMREKEDKASSGLYRRIVLYIELLSRKGLSVGMPVMRRIDGDIWELRPQRYRIFFFGVNGDSFVLLHHYFKKTEKTPRSEIDRAHKEMERFMKEKQNDRE
ncbi:MAG: type II toxin-antitoxin system RelE/ParE family toxin [Erysipelotrichaceae bacterium]|jgi:phage-related protein|nr:type II toxin-antitoxin system RelE/ParE family toxin [Erysipelotrichaceae bacterium]